MSNLAPEDFTTGLLSFCSDVTVCCYTTLCAPCQNSKTWAELNGETCQCKHLLFFVDPFWVRQTIRRRRHMEEKCMGDCCAEMCCLYCVVCQNAREVGTGSVLPPETEYYKGNEPNPTVCGGQQPKMDHQPGYPGAQQQQVVYAQPPPQPQMYAQPPPQMYAQPQQQVYVQPTY